MRVWGRLACDIEVWRGLAGVSGDPPTPPFWPLPLFIDPPLPHPIPTSNSGFEYCLGERRNGTFYGTIERW